MTTMKTCMECERPWKRGHECDDGPLDNVARRRAADPLASALAVVFAYKQQPATDGTFELGDEPTSYWRDRAQAVRAALGHSVVVRRTPHTGSACYGQCHDAVQAAVGAHRVDFGLPVWKEDSDESVPNEVRDWYLKGYDDGRLREQEDHVCDY